MTDTKPSLCPSNLDLVTPETVDFVESKTTECLNFIYESRQILCAEAHSTLNWLFGVIVGGTGFIVSALDKPNPSPAWLLVGVSTSVVISAVAAAQLIQLTLKARPAIPKGNEPKNLMTDTAMKFGLMWMKVKELSSNQDRIDFALQHNRIAAKSVNRARWILILLPLISAITAGIAIVVVAVSDQSIENRSPAADSAPVAR